MNKNSEKGILIRWLQSNSGIEDKKVIGDAVKAININSCYDLELYKNYNSFCKDATIEQSSIQSITIEGKDKNGNVTIKNEEKFEKTKLLYRYSEDDLFCFKYKDGVNLKKYVPNFRKGLDTIVILEREITLIDKDTDEIITKDEFNTVHIYSDKMDKEQYINYELVQEAEFFWKLRKSLPSLEYKLIDDELRVFECTLGEKYSFDIEFHKDYETHIACENKEYLNQYLDVFEKAVGDSYLYDIYNEEEGKYYFRWYTLDQDLEYFYLSHKDKCEEYLEDLWSKSRM